MFLNNYGNFFSSLFILAGCSRRGGGAAGGNVGGAGNAGGGGGSAGLSNATRLSGLLLCRTWIRMVSLNTVTSSDPLEFPEFCLSLRLLFSFRSTAATIASGPKNYTDRISIAR